MISREQIEKYRVTGMWDDPMHWPEFIDTLDVALKVIDKIKKIYDGPLVDDEFIVAIGRALAPFTAPRGKA